MGVLDWIIEPDEIWKFIGRLFLIIVPLGIITGEVLVYEISGEFLI